MDGEAGQVMGFVCNPLFFTTFLADLAEDSKYKALQTGAGDSQRDRPVNQDGGLCEVEEQTE